jgi:elongation factor G
MREGVIAGYPMVDVKVTLDDGSSHPVDSSELAFKLAGQIALRKAAQEAGPVLLEPIVEVEVVTPEEVLGDIMGDLNGKRGKIQGTEQRESLQVVKALVPLAEVASYGADLRRMAQGRADFTMKFSHYEEMPAHLADQVIAAYKRDKGESADE